MKLNRTAEEWAAMQPDNIPMSLAQQDIAALHAEIALLHALFEPGQMATAYTQLLNGNRPGWQPMNTAPKDGREILVRGLAEGQYIHFIVWHARDRWWGDYCYEHVKSSDQWHEIPA